jgi:hypothetical protein
MNRMLPTETLHSLRKTQISTINPSSDEHNRWTTRQYSIEKFLKYIYFRRQFLVQARSRTLRPFSGIEAFPSTEIGIPGKENDEGHNGDQFFFVNCKTKQLFLPWEEIKKGWEATIFWSLSTRSRGLRPQSKQTFNIRVSFGNNAK